MPIHDEPTAGLDDAFTARIMAPLRRLTAGRATCPCGGERRSRPTADGAPGEVGDRLGAPGASSENLRSHS
ncbi:hypothetical protein [Streptomyces sp. MMG1121]|uniref:hypothetical protein n=1 Tax=Streptomyces sp. MMG1121 TaxID=1415544 RepID=UPI0006B06923|nr:hypothetical protein [Streptomyces sp. MMG1121]KOV60423.1 hypothetical protein ADK64_29895 [Streptomyces sp. MMG1121]